MPLNMSHVSSSVKWEDRRERWSLRFFPSQKHFHKLFSDSRCLLDYSIRMSVITSDSTCLKQNALPDLTCQHSISVKTYNAHSPCHSDLKLGYGFHTASYLISCQVLPTFLHKVPFLSLIPYSFTAWTLPQSLSAMLPPASCPLPPREADSSWKHGLAHSSFCLANHNCSLYRMRSNI